MATVVTDGYALNVRAWCDTDAPVMGQLENGAEVELLETGDDWSKISRGELEGYCMTKYLRWE